MNYGDFVARKLTLAPSVGVRDVPTLHAALFAHQHALVDWALRKGRAAIFADTGLGKTLTQLEFARHAVPVVGRPAMIFAPLAVTEQTARDGARIGLDVNVCAHDSDVRDGLNITNYDKLDRFDVDRFGVVVLDESSILKAYDGKTRTAILVATSRTPFRLALTATPAPNDYTELGNHAEFLGVCTRAEMLATYFCHDGGDTQTWRLKGHARADFWRWVASWARVLRKPSDLGFSDAGYDLPPLTWHEHVVATDGAIARGAGMLFATDALTLSDQRAVRRASLDARVAVLAGLVAREPHESWLIWCELNDESTALAKAIPGAVEIAGSDEPSVKAARMLAFAAGELPILVTKPSIAGFGMNWQQCARVAFAGASHSFEQVYQSVRRCWRFGQTREVHAHLVRSDADGAVVANLRRKEEDAAKMQSEMVRAMRELQRAEVRATGRVSDAYEPRVPLHAPAWLKSLEVAS